MRSKVKSVTPLLIFSTGLQLSFDSYQNMERDGKNVCENLAEFLYVHAVSGLVSKTILVIWKTC